MLHVNDLSWELKSIAELVIDEGNPREHTQEAIDKIKKSLQYFGWAHPIQLQAGTNRILTGHARVLAAEQLGETVVPVQYLPFDDRKSDAWNVTDNRTQELNGWSFPKLKDRISEIDDGSFDIDTTGWSPVELDNVFDYEPPEAPLVNLSDEPSMSENFIIKCKDEDEVEKLQQVFGTKGRKIPYEQAWEIIGQLL